MMAYNPTFQTSRAILNSSFYAYSATVDSFVIVCFYVEKHYIPQYQHWLKRWVCACLSYCFGQDDWSFGCVKSCTCSYTRTLHFLIPRSRAYLDSLGKLVFRGKSGFKSKCRARAGFGLQNEAIYSSVLQAP